MRIYPSDILLIKDEAWIASYEDGDMYLVSLTGRGQSAPIMADWDNGLPYINSEDKNLGTLRDNLNKLPVGASLFIRQLDNEQIKQKYFQDIVC